MAITVGGTNITFNDGSTQSTAATTQALKVWINFNGTGTGSIRASSGVSTLGYIAAGQFQINFSPTLADANYAVSFGCGGADNGRAAMYLLPTANGSVGTPEGTNKTASFVQVGGNISTNPNQPFPSMNVAIFR